MTQDIRCPLCGGELELFSETSSYNDKVITVGSGEVYMPHDLNASSCEVGPGNREQPRTYRCKECGHLIDIFSKPL